MNNLLLAILLKNFRWLFFRLRLNNPFIVQGVKNRLCVIQFTRCSFCFSLSRLACLFYHAQSHLSRTFFKFFHFPLRIFALASAPRRKLAYTIISCCVCQGFFHFFISDFSYPLFEVSDPCFSDSSIFSLTNPSHQDMASRI